MLTITRERQRARAMYTLDCGLWEDFLMSQFVQVRMSPLLETQLKEFFLMRLIEYRISARRKVVTSCQTLSLC